MKVAKCLVGFVAIAVFFAFAMSANAQLLYHDKFEGSADGTLLLDHAPILGSAWTDSVGVIIENNRAIFDPTRLNPVEENGMVIGGTDQNARPHPAEGLPWIVPAWTTGQVIEFQVKLIEPGAGNTTAIPFPGCGTDENGDPGPQCRGQRPVEEGGSTYDLSGDGVHEHQDMQLAEIRLQPNGGNEVYVPALGNSLFKNADGTYFVGGYGAGAAFHVKDNENMIGAKVNKISIPAAGSGDEVIFRSTLRGLEQGYPDAFYRDLGDSDFSAGVGTDADGFYVDGDGNKIACNTGSGCYTGNQFDAGVEGIVDLSNDDGATWQRIGRFFRPFINVDGTGPDFPGEINQAIIIARGPRNPGEGEFHADFFRVEIRDHVANAGDMDHDGDVDFDDISPFVGALNDQAAYNSAYFVPASESGDTDGDDDLDFDDITGFVDILSGGGAQGVPEPTSLLLVLLGGLGLGLYRWRTRK